MDYSFDIYNYSSVDYSDPPNPARIGVPVFVAVLSVIGVFGNVFMMYAILRPKHMRTTPNILIFNLAVADFMYIVVTTPIYVKHELDPYPESGFSEAGCKIKNYLAFAAQYASVFALAALSRERYTAIVGAIPKRHGGEASSRCFRLKNASVVLLVWLASFLLTIPTLFFAHTNEGQCRVSPSDITLGRINDCERFLIGYVIPLVVVAFYYIKIAISLFRSAHSFQNDYVSPGMAHQMRVRKRLAASVLVITIFFAVCWFPYFFYYFFISFAPLELLLLDPSWTIDFYRYLGIVTPVINTSLDPWLLFVISSRHRACLVGCLGFHQTSSTNSRTYGVTTKRVHLGSGTSFSRSSRV